MRSAIVRAGWYAVGVLTVVLAIHGHVEAGGRILAPEIDGSSLSAGLGLLAAGAMILRARMRSK